MKNFIFKSALLLAFSAFSFGCSSDDNQDVVTPTPVVTKTKVTVTKIQISQIPQSDSNGLPWDFSSNPDIYIKLYDENNFLGYTSNYMPDFMPSITNPLTLIFSNLSTTNVSSGILKVEVWDNDINDSPSNPDDKIGEASFYLYDYTTGPNKYPASAVKNVDGTLVTLYMTWE